MRCSLAGIFPTAVAAFACAGVLNSYFFASTLAARSEYAPPAARGQVFVWIGALKITAGSAGTALAGALIAPATRLPLYLASGLIVLTVVTSIVDRYRSRTNLCAYSGEAQPDTAGHGIC